MGWGERSNSRREEILADKARLRRFLLAHPEEFRALMQATIHQSWADVQAWMAKIDAGEGA